MVSFMQVIEKHTENRTLHTDSYAEYCFDNFGVNELYSNLNSQPKPNDLIKWGLTVQQWRQEVELAIQAIKND